MYSLSLYTMHYMMGSSSVSSMRLVYYVLYDLLHNIYYVLSLMRLVYYVLYDILHNIYYVLYDILHNIYYVLSLYIYYVLYDAQQLRLFHAPGILCTI